jgi:hypothetical protein
MCALPGLPPVPLPAVSQCHITWARILSQFREIAPKGCEKSNMALLWKNWPHHSTFISKTSTSFHMKLVFQKINIHILSES